MSVSKKLALRTGAIALAATLALGACAVNERRPPRDPSTAAQGAFLSGTLNGMGASAQSAAQTFWAAGFQDAHPDVTVNYDPQGSGAGRTAFLQGGVAFAGSDSPMRAEHINGDLPLCEEGVGPINLPVYISPIAIAYNLPDVQGLVLDAEVLALIFSGQITRWDDDRVVALNPSADLPDLPLTVVRRADDSGTTHNFTEYLEANAPQAWGEPSSQTFPFAVGDAAKGTSGVADATRSALGAITYTDLSGASGLQLASLRVGDGVSQLSTEGVAAVVAQSPAANTGLETDSDLAIAVDHEATEAGAWPLLLVSYLVVCEHYADAELGALVGAYATYIVSPKAQQAASEGTGSAPLDGDLAARVLTVAEAIG